MPVFLKKNAGIFRWNAQQPQCVFSGLWSVRSVISVGAPMRVGVPLQEPMPGDT